MPDPPNPVQRALTIIEIRPYRNGWQCFEAPGVQPYLTRKNAKQSGIVYAKNWLERALLKTAILGTIALAALSFGRFATASTTQYLYNSFAEVGTEVGYVEPWEINESGQVTGRGFADFRGVPFVTGPGGADLRLVSLAPPASHTSY